MDLVISWKISIWTRLDEWCNRGPCIVPSCSISGEKRYCNLHELLFYFLSGKEIITRSHWDLGPRLGFGPNRVTLDCNVILLVRLREIGLFKTRL